MKKVTLVWAMVPHVAIYRVVVDADEDLGFVGFNGVCVLYGEPNGKPEELLPFSSGGATLVRYSDTNCSSGSICFSVIWNDWSNLAPTPKNPYEAKKHVLFLTRLTQAVRLFVENTEITGKEMLDQVCEMAANEWLSSH